MWQRSRIVLHVTWRSCSNVSGTSWKVLEEDVTKYQVRLASDLTKMLERIRNILQVTWRRVYNVSGTSGKLLGTRCGNVAGSSCMLLEEAVPTYQVRLGRYLKKMLQCIKYVLQVTWRRCYNVSGTSCKLLGEDVTLYQKRTASYLIKMWQRIRNVLQVTWRRCYTIPGTSCKLLEEDVTT